MSDRMKVSLSELFPSIEATLTDTSGMIVHNEVEEESNTDDSSDSEESSNTEVMFSEDQVTMLWNKSKNDRLYFNKIDTLFTVLDVVDVGEELHPLFDMMFNLKAEDDVPHRLLDFLEDCFNFIETGQRKVAVTTWLCLLNDKSKYLTNKNRMDRIDNIRFRAKRTLSKENIQPIDCVILWCSNLGGLRDLVFSLYYVNSMKY